MSSCLACGAPLTERGFTAEDRLHGTPGGFVVVECSVCGAGRTLPPAELRDLAGYYPGSYAPYEPAARPLERVISSLIRRWQGFSALRRPPLDALAKAPPGTALDVGCGRGDLAGYLAARGWRMSGIEPSPAAAQAASAQGVDVQVGVLATVQLQPLSLDGVVFHQSLEHTEEPVADLQRVFGALRPGGAVCISVPNFGGRQARRFRTNWYHLDVPRHRTHFTGVGLRAALESAGFTDIELSSTTSPVGLPASIQYRIFGRCLFPDGLKLRIAAGLCVLGLPIALLVDTGKLQGDVLHAVARRP